MRNGTKLRNWMTLHIPSDQMVYKQAWCNTYNFWDYYILELFSNVWKQTHDLDAFDREINGRVDIVGEHRSKSIVHPVLKIAYKDAVIVFRYNFYDYNIAVISSKPLSLPINTLFKSGSVQFMCEGFPDEYILAGRYEENQCEFMAYVNNHYEFYTLMFLIRQELDRMSQTK